MLNIAKTRYGRNVLYDINKIHQVGISTAGGKNAPETKISNLMDNGSLPQPTSVVNCWGEENLNITNEFGKNKIVDYVKNQIGQGNLLDASTKKASNWFTSRGLQLPKEVQTILDANNILTEKSKVVNTHYMQNSHDYSFDESGRQIKNSSTCYKSEQKPPT